MIEEDKEISLECLKKDCLACRKCVIGGKTLEGVAWKWDGESEWPPISNVFSSMNVKAEVMIVGQNPGYNEVVEGEPFVGKSGEFFNETIRDVLGMCRDQMYITNAVHCYTPKNRKPRVSEIENCSTFLDAEVEVIRPKVIVALGSIALRQTTGMGKITKREGNIVPSIRYKLPVVPLFHPSPYNMRDEDKRDKFREGMKLVLEILNG